MSFLIMIDSFSELEGREFEERMITDTDPYIGSKLQMEEDIVAVILTSLSRHSFSHRSPKTYPILGIQSAISLKIATTKNFALNSVNNSTNTMNEIQKTLCFIYLNYGMSNFDTFNRFSSNLLLNQENQFQPLKQFFLDKCKQSVHFALQAYLLVRASKDSREPPKKKKVIPQSIIKWRILCNSLLAEIRKAISVPSM